jgi:hypothetical protein
MSELESLDTDFDFQPIILFLGIAILFIGGYYYYMSNQEYILETLDAKIIEWKDSLGFYTNQLLLKLNMEGSAVKTTQILNDRI